MEELREQIAELRVEINRCAQIIKELKQGRCEPHLMTQEEMNADSEYRRNGWLPVWYEKKSGDEGWQILYYLDKLNQGIRYWSWRPSRETKESTPW